MTGPISLAQFYAQTQNEMQSGLVQHITNESIFMRILRFLPCDALTYEYAKQMTLGGVAFRGINQSYTSDVGVVNPERETLHIFGGMVETDRVLAEMRGGAARTNAVMAKTRAAGLYFDRMVIHGDPATNAKSFYGLKARLSGNQVMYANGNATNGGIFTLDDVDALLNAVAGPNSAKVLVMNRWCRTKLKQLLVAAAGGASVVDVSTGVTKYDGANVEEIDEDGDEQAILGFDETRGASTDTCSMYCVRPGTATEGEWVQGLVHPVQGQMIVHAPLAPNNTKIPDLIEMVAGLAVFHGRAASRLAGIRKANPT